MKESFHSTTTLFSSPEDVARAIQAAALAGVTVQVLPNETQAEKRVAADIHATSAQMTGDTTIDPNTWRRQAFRAMGQGGAVVHLYPLESDDPSLSGDRVFWEAYTKLREQGNSSS